MPGYDIDTDTFQSASAAWANEPDIAPDAPLEPSGDAGAAAPLPEGGEAAGGAVASAEAAVAEAAASGDAAATEAAVEYLEAVLGETRQQLRADLQLPIKINGKQEYVNLSEMQRGYQRTEDYTRKTMALAQEREAFRQQQREVELAQRTAAATRELVAEEHKRMIEARQDPEKFAKYLDHIERMESDPEYREVYERSERLRLREVEDQTVEALSMEDEQAKIVEDIVEFATGLGDDEKYKGKVDPAHAMALYNEWLVAGSATLHSRDLRRAFDTLLANRERTVAPLERELQALRTSVAELTAAQKASQHNDRTRTRVAASASPGRSAVPPAAGARTPAGAPRESAPARRETLQERSKAWARS